MNDTIIAFERIDNATLTASAGSDTNYPLLNLKDGRFKTQWMAGTDAAGQTIEVEFPTPRQCKSALIANHNFSSIGADSINLEYYSGSWQLLHTLSSLSDDPIFVDGFDQTVSKYRIKFNKVSGNLSQKPKIGMIFLGKEAALPLILNNPKRGLKNAISLDESISGLIYRTSLKAPRETWGIDFGGLRAEKNAEIWRWLKGIDGGLHPYWLRDMDDNWHFVGLEGDAFDIEAKGNAVFALRGLKMSEERVGQPTILPGGYTV